MTEELTQTQGAETVSSPSLGLADLVTVAQLIQLATQRGAFNRAEELSTVGNLYDRLVAFLESAGAINRTETTDGPAPSVQNNQADTQENTNVKTRRKA
jgi:hypothetical protein